MSGKRSIGAVEVSVTIAAQPATVFRFLTDPVRFAQWMGGGATGQSAPGTTIDARPGGAMVVTYPGGAKALGEVVEVDEPERFVFTWGYEGGANAIPPGSCTVTITLEPCPGGTRVALRHEGISSDESRAGHETGWRFYLSVLAARASHEQFADTLPRVGAAYFDAWKQTDAADRRASLDRACDPGVSFRDGYGSTDGVAALDAHIANAQKHMPSVELRARGRASVVHGCARIPWDMALPDGTVIGTGELFARLASDGRLREIVGFSDAG